MESVKAFLDWPVILVCAPKSNYSRTNNGEMYELSLQFSAVINHTYDSELEQTRV